MADEMIGENFSTLTYDDRHPGSSCRKMMLAENTWLRQRITYEKREFYLFVVI